MKKRISLLSCVCAALVCGSALICAQSRMGNKSLIYENIEALSQEEALVPHECHKRIQEDNLQTVFYCGECAHVRGRQLLIPIKGICYPKN